MRPITSFERSMRFVFGLAFAVLFSTIMVSIFVINKLTENANWVAHTHQVIAKTNEVSFYFGNARVSTKNFLLTHQPRHLAPRISSINSINEAMSELKSLTNDNTFQQKQIDVAWNSVREYLDFTTSIIEDVDKNGIVPEKISKWTDQTNEVAIKTAAYLKRIRDEEIRLLEERQGRAASFTNQAYGTLPIMLIIQALVTAYIYQRVLHECQSS